MYEEQIKRGLGIQDGLFASSRFSQEPKIVIPVRVQENVSWREIAPERFLSVFVDDESKGVFRHSCWLRSYVACMSIRIADGMVPCKSLVFLLRFRIDHVSAFRIGYEGADFIRNAILDVRKIVPEGLREIFYHIFPRFGITRDNPEPKPYLFMTHRTVDAIE